MRSRISAALRTVALAAACATFLMIAPPKATAATIACPGNISGLVTGAVACQYSDSATQDFLNTNPMTVNGEAFFSYTDWQFLEKDDPPVGGTKSGTYSFTRDPSWSDVMLIFKSGDDTFLVGYLLDDGVSSGSWESPFRDPPFDFKNDETIKDVSHISYYYREGRSTVPIPGTLALLGFGLMAAVAMRRRTA